MSQCGHINLSSYDPEGKPDGLACTLESGHAGNHKAMHFERKRKFDPVSRSVVVMSEGDVEREWSDEAGEHAETEVQE